MIILLVLSTCLSIARSDVSSKRHSCRVSSDAFYDEKTFASLACGQCFYYTFLLPYRQTYVTENCPNGVLICPKSELSKKFGRQNCTCRSEKFVYNLRGYGSSKNNLLENLSMKPNLPKNFVQLTRDCCKAAEKCCQAMIAQPVANTSQCPMTWDGWQCWQPAKPGTEVRGECPYYTYSMPNIMSTPDPKDYFSVKECTDEAKWWKSYNSTVEWTDYRECATSKLYEESLKHFLGISAFAISVLAIIPALIIFNIYRSLRVDRIRIHKHLLLSLLLTGMFYIFNNVFFIVDDAPGSSMLESNHTLCRLAFLIQLRYFRTSNYMWMLCEGFYLYKLLLIDAFSSENSSLIIYYLSGWAFPAIPTIIYAVLRYIMDDEKCWLGSNIVWIEWVTYGPCIASLALNFLLMISIIRVLITKLTHSPANEPAQYRKAVRATLVLLPLFGCHFFLTIYKFEHLLWYEILNKLLDGFQGLFVATIICFTHGEVLELLRKSWKRWHERRTLKKESRGDRHSKSQTEPSGRFLL